ncbi:MAG: hypothetical protein KBF13_03375 [Prevotella sp.]|nr:hypothetical protein [Prevotella sp.]
MRREGYIIEEIVEYHNMSESFDTVLSGRKRKKSRTGRNLLARKEKKIEKFIDCINSGWSEEIKYREIDVVDGIKHRRLQVISIEDRIKAGAVMNVVDNHLRKRFIRTTSASIKNRGMHDLLNYIRRDIHEDPEGTLYGYKFDISKFYESVIQDFVMYCVKRVFKDKLLINILEKLVKLLKKGISIGLRSSQGLGNLLLSVFLDHYLKDKYGVAHFYRYCDDGLILAETKEELWKIRDVIHEQMAKIGLTIKDNERVFPVSEGIDFLGYVIYPDHVALRKRIKKKFARKMKKVKSKKRRHALIASFYGMSKHADCNNLFNKLTGKDMKSFKDLNVAYKPADGKKRFAGSVVSVRELVNLPIVVKDFETGIQTDQGEDRCLVSIEANGEAKKFFTNSDEMKNILAQVSEMTDGFPFETTIKTETFGKGRTKYVFT